MKIEIEVIEKRMQEIEIKLPYYSKNSISVMKIFDEKKVLHVGTYSKDIVINSYVEWAVAGVNKNIKVEEITEAEFLEEYNKAVQYFNEIVNPIQDAATSE